MFAKIKKFWDILINSIKDAYSGAILKPQKEETQVWEDTSRINFLAIIVSKLNNLTNSEATFDIVAKEGGEKIVAPLAKQCQDIEDNRFEIASGMMAKGDYFIFPALNSKGELYHSYLSQDNVRILSMDGANITEAYGIIDWFIDKNKKMYFLLRHHILEPNGTLTVSYSAVNENNQAAYVEKWQDLNGEAYSFINANHIGFGRYKSPFDSRGLSPIYGVPANFGCAEIERTLFHDIEELENEYDNARSIIFADDSILVEPTAANGNKHRKIADNIFPYRKRSGENGPFVEIYNPDIRKDARFEKITQGLKMYEKTIGVNDGILSEQSTTSNATATEVKRANKDTIALIDRIRTAIDVGNVMTLEADGVFLNIPREAWEYTPDWFDPFEDPTEQWQRIKDGVDMQVVETSDAVRWIFPKLSQEEIDNKLHRIADEQTAREGAAIDRILAGG